MAEGKYVLENTTIRRLNHIFFKKTKNWLHIQFSLQTICYLL